MQLTQNKIDTVNNKGFSGFNIIPHDAVKAVSTNLYKCNAIDVNAFNANNKNIGV